MVFWTYTVPASLVLNLVAVFLNPWFPWFGLAAGAPLALSALIRAGLLNSASWAIFALVIWVGNWLLVYELGVNHVIPH
jgi:hypothetical protein